MNSALYFFDLKSFTGQQYLEMESVSNERVKYLLNQLPPRQKEALTLYYIQEKKYEDICMLMDMNYQSVRNLIHRGILKLRSIAV